MEGMIVQMGTIIELDKKEYRVGKFDIIMDTAFVRLDRKFEPSVNLIIYNKE